MRIGYEMADNGPGSRPEAYIAAYNYIATYIRDWNQVENVSFVFHTIRGEYFIDLYPGPAYVDWVGISIFNHDICLYFDGWNCGTPETVDPNLVKVLEWAKYDVEKPIIIAESAIQTNSEQRDDLSHWQTGFQNISALIEKYDIQGWVYINILWDAPNYDPPRTWGDDWGDSRVERNDDILSLWFEVTGSGRFIDYGGILLMK